MEHIEDMKKFIEWAWKCYGSLMRKHKYLSRETIVITAHIGLQSKLMQHFYIEHTQTAVYVDRQTEKIVVFGLRIEFSDDYDKYTCSIGVPDWRPGVDLNGKQNERPETFTVNIHSLIK